MRSALVVILILTLAPIAAAEPGFFTRLSYLFSGNEQTLDLPDTSQAPDAVPWCNACSAIVCGTDEQFLCPDTWVACELKYNSCKQLTCDVPWQDDDSCVWNGRTYDDGESFKNDCNTCTCTDGNIACTLMACADDTPAGDECTVDADCPELMCATEPCGTNQCINGKCTTVNPTCHGVGRWCTEMGGECCSGLVCDVDVDPDDVRGANLRGLCVRPTSNCGNGVCAADERETCSLDCAGKTCGDGICQEWERDYCKPCNPAPGESCPGFACQPEENLCPQDCT